MSPIPLTTANKILPGQASALQASYLTLVKAIQQNTIRSPSNLVVLLLQSNVFQYTQYKTGISTILPYQHAMEFSKRMVEEQLNHVSGDRRLDGTDIIQTIEGYKDFVQLIKVCDDSK